MTDVFEEVANSDASTKEEPRILEESKISIKTNFNPDQKDGEDSILARLLEGFFIFNYLKKAI